MKREDGSKHSVTIIARRVLSTLEFLNVLLGRRSATYVVTFRGKHNLMIQLKDNNPTIRDYLTNNPDKPDLEAIPEFAFFRPVSKNRRTNLTNGLLLLGLLYNPATIRSMGGGGISTYIHTTSKRIIFYPDSKPLQGLVDRFGLSENEVISLLRERGQEFRLPSQKHPLSFSMRQLRSYAAMSFNGSVYAVRDTGT
ncbi:MAG: hypothetical protein N2691_03490 [Patescibacteria group bacterium]|nr:hypothetical protein [Patescibacteria group bacterium]